jgi:hypothetical protein
MTQPATPTVAGASLGTMTVLVRDAFANVVPSVTVTLAPKSGSAWSFASGTTSQATTSASGVATFDDVQVERTGVAYMMTATTSNGLSQDSASFTIIGLYVCACVNA